MDDLLNQHMPEEIEVKRTAKDMMRELRKSWREIGFVDTVQRVHVADKEYVAAITLLMTGQRILSVIESEDDDAVDMALTFSERHGLKNAVTLHEITVWRGENQDTSDKAALTRYEITLESMTTQLTFGRKADNADADLQTQGITADKYREAALLRAQERGWSYVATAQWRMLQLGRWAVL